MHTIIETPDYLSDARSAGLTGRERSTIVEYFAAHPDADDPIPGTGGARKVRFAGRGRGKSGGYRVISFYSGPDVPIFLLNVFAKGDKINVTLAERNELRTILTDLVTAYRQGTRRYEQGRK